MIFIKMTALGFALDLNLFGHATAMLCHDQQARSNGFEMSLGLFKN